MKQKIATGFLAMLIVGSVAMMPVNAEVKDTWTSPTRQYASIAAPLNAPEQPPDQIRDLTYN